MTEEQLKERFLIPYENGDPIIINGKTIILNDLDRILISRSEESSSKIIEKIKIKDRNSSVLVIAGFSYEWQAAAESEDITDQFIKGHPGHKSDIFKSKENKLKEEDKSKNKVFIVHGHDHKLKSDLEIFLREIKLEPIVLHRQPDEGLTLIEKFERYSNVTFAFIILTPDDVGFTKDEYKLPENKHNPEYRARQNVIFEFGYFVGKLGRSNVCCIYKEGVELPSDLSGLLYKKIVTSIEEIRYSLIKELKNAGLKPQI